jgi:hypothetical protein
VSNFQKCCDKEPLLEEGYRVMTGDKILHVHCPSCKASAQVYFNAAPDCNDNRYKDALNDLKELWPKAIVRTKEEGTPMRLVKADGDE